MASYKEEIPVLPGTPLLDILNIIYLGADDVTPENQVGSIKLCSCPNIRYIYNQVDDGDHNTKSTLKYGDPINVRLHGPIHASGGTHYLEFHLFRGAYKGTVDLSWEPEDGELGVQRQELYSTDGTGKILVVTAQCASAVVANLEVKLLKSAARNVYGGIFASNTIFQRPHCANVLFLEKPGTGIKIGRDGVITLSKSCVGVPLHSELNVDLSLYLDDACHNIQTLSFNQNILVDVKSVALDKETAVISVRVSWGRMVVLFPCDSVNGFCVEEDLALNFHSLRDQIKGSEEIMPNINLPCISNRTLCGVIDYFGRHFNTPNFGPTATFVQQDILINLIQAAHYFKMRSLMDYTCQFLAVKVRTKEPMVIIEEFQTHLIDFKSVEQHQKSDQLAAIRGKVSKSPDRILRQRRKETFINKWRLVTVLIPSYVIKQLVTVERWNSVFIKYRADVYHLYSIRDFEKLTEVFEWLIDFIMEDIKFADLLRADDVKMLLDILMKNNHHENKEIQGLAVKIFSYAISREKYHGYMTKAVEYLVKLMSDSSVDINIMGVDALTRVAYAYPGCIKVILDHDALEKMPELLDKSFPLYLDSSCELIKCAANFLVAVCCGDFDFNKVNLALAIAEEIFQKELDDNNHKMLACYALQYLTYENPVKFEEAAWKKLIATLIKFSMNFDGDEDIDASPQSEKISTTDTGLAASALGIVGNVARWGNLDQIQNLAGDTSLMECLRKMLRSGIKKFRKEACQIISNIAARNTTWIHDMYKFDLIESLCNLLLEGDMSVSDIKLEAAWAIFNGIYGCDNRQVDEYPRI